MTTDEKLIIDIKNLIKFYEGIGQSNPQLDTYIKKLYKQLEELQNKNK
jgi:hypothetical protein